MSILMVTGAEGARNCAAAIGVQLGTEVEVAEGRRSASSALRRGEFQVVVIDETLAECDPAAADAICELAGLAIPLQINFALTGAARLVREIRSALRRREREHTFASRAAYAVFEAKLKSTVAGLLLNSELALNDGGNLPPQVAERLRVVVDLAGSLRSQLSAAAVQPGARAGQRGPAA
jgi:hypothetical protein